MPLLASTTPRTARETIDAMAVEYGAGESYEWPEHVRLRLAVAANNPAAARKAIDVAEMHLLAMWARGKIAGISTPVTVERAAKRAEALAEFLDAKGHDDLAAKQRARAETIRTTQTLSTSTTNPPKENAMSKSKKNATKSTLADQVDAVAKKAAAKHMAKKITPEALASREAKVAKKALGTKKEKKAPAPAKRDARLPEVGTTIEKKDREGKVRAHCKVTADGVEYKGTTYKSLSGAAMAAAADLGLKTKTLNGFLWWQVIQAPKTAKPEAK